MRSFRLRLRKPWPPLAKLGVFAIGLPVLIALVAQQVLAQQPPPQNAAAPRKQAQTTPAPDPAAATADQTSTRSEKTAPAGLEEKIRKIVASGRIQQIGESSSARLNPAPSLAPGAPPILAFRYFDGQARHRFGDLDLVMDDAGH